jgi:hypothetical protein
MHLYSIIIFSVVLLIYLHVIYHLKKNNTKEVYYLENISKEKVEELCDLRQPAVFNYENQPIRDSILVTMCDKKHDNVNIRNSINIENYIPLSLNKTQELFEKDDKSTYYSENNTEFISSGGINHIIDSNDYYLKPCMVASKTYDIMFGSKKAYSPLRYDINYRNFYYCLKGSVKIKLAPPKSSEYLSETKNYNTFEFSSPINPWNVQDEYMFDMKNVDTLDVTLREGQVLYIPSFWWYSIEFQKEAVISTLKYRTYMNTLAVLPRFILRVFQMQNVSHKLFPTTELVADSVSEKKEGPIVKVVDKPFKQNKRQEDSPIHLNDENESAK